MVIRLLLLLIFLIAILQAKDIAGTHYLCLMSQSKTILPVYISEDSIDIQYSYGQYLDFKQCGKGYCRNGVVIFKLGNTLELRGYNKETKELTVDKRTMVCSPL